MIGDLVNAAAGGLGSSFGAAAPHGYASPANPHFGMPNTAAPFSQQQLSAMGAGGVSAFSSAAYRAMSANRNAQPIVYRSTVYIYGPWIALSREISFVSADGYQEKLRELECEHPGDIIDDTEARAEFMRMELGHD